MNLLTKRIFTAILVLMLAKPAHANEADDAVAASHASARAGAQNLLFTHVMSSLMGVLTNLPVATSADADQIFKNRFNSIKARVMDLQNQTDVQLMTPVEDQILADAQTLLADVSAQYREGLLDYNRTKQARNSYVSNQSDFLRQLGRVSNGLTSLCTDGVAQQIPNAGFTSPQFAFPEFRVEVSIGSSNGQTASKGQMKGGTLFNAEGEAAFAAGTSYLATLFPIGTAVAVVLWATYGLVQDEQRRAMMKERTEMVFHYYENAAYAEDVRRYYKVECAPMMNDFKRITEEMALIQARQETPSLRSRSVDLAHQYKPILDHLQQISNTILEAQKAAIAKLKPDATDEEKQAAANAAVDQVMIINLRNYMLSTLKGAKLGGLIEHIFLSSAYKIRDNQLSVGSVDQVEAKEMLNGFSAKIYDLQRLSYRLHLLKQNPGLVAFFESEIKENSTALALYKRWVALFARALTSKVAISTDTDIRISAAAFHADLTDALKNFPMSLALQQMLEREQILQEVLK